MLGAASLALLSAGPAFGLPKGMTVPAPVTQTVKPAAITSDTGTTSTSTATTDPVGYTSISLQANSDTLVSIPFTRPATFAGAIASVSGSTITLSGSPGWTSNQYVYAAGTQSNTYYAIIGPLLTSLTNTVSVTNASTSVTGSGFTPIAQGDELLVNGLAYNVASVTNDTTLILSRAYTGTTATGLTASYNHSPKEGSYYTVTANGTNTLTVTLNGDSLSTVAAGTTMSLIPYWTLGTTFPASDAGTSYVTSANTATRNYQTRILLPNLTDAGINLSSKSSYFNYNGAWRIANSDGTVSYDDTILPPTTYFTVRNSTSGTTFTPSGGVYMNRISTPLDVQTSSGQDNPVTVPRPVDVSLNDLGLIVSGAFVPSATTATRSLKDVLMVYDNTSAGINKSFPTSYYYYNGGWRQTNTDGMTDYGTVTIPAGTGFLIRKAALTSGATSFWQNTRSY